MRYTNLVDKTCSVWYNPYIGILKCIKIVHCNTIYERRIDMKIPLPCKDYVFPDGSAEIRDWILYIHRIKSVKDVMYKITYMIYGDDECYYCHRKLKDHVEPKN